MHADNAKHSRCRFHESKSAPEPRGAFVPAQTAMSYGLVRSVNEYALKIELIGV